MRTIVLRVKSAMGDPVDERMLLGAAHQIHQHYPPGSGWWASDIANAIMRGIADQTIFADRHDDTPGFPVQGEEDF